MSLHEALGVPPDKRIPLKDLAKMAHADDDHAKAARLAMKLRRVALKKRQT